MIFKKPYAFFIKYFRLINFILACVSVFVAVKTYNIIVFFNEYIIHDYSGSFYNGFSDNYISVLLKFMIILILIGALIIVILFIYKKKPLKAYLSCVIYYVAFYIFINITKNLMVTLETEVITAEAARIYRDLSLLSIIPQIFFILLFLLRSLGLNLGRFKFQEDLKKLEISEQDNEEVEITFQKENSKLKRNTRRFLREFNYYIKENKFVFIIICLVLTGILGLGIYNLIPKNYDTIYRQGETFVINDITYKIEDSIITNLNYNGDIIDNNYYVVVKLYVENNSKEEKNLDFNIFRLNVEEKFLYPLKGEGKNFIDYATNSIVDKIKPDSKDIYSLVYKININNKQESYKIKINNGVAYDNNKTINKYNYINITPIVINEVNVEDRVTAGNKINFMNSNLSNSSIKLSNPVITTKYTYNYEFCVNNKCNTYKDMINLDYTKNDKILIVLDYEYNLDKNVPYYKYSNSINAFVNSFIKVRFLENENIVYEMVKDVTPKNLKNKIVLETSNKIKNNKDIDLSIIVRNKEYLIDLN